MYNNNNNNNTNTRHTISTLKAVYLRHGTCCMWCVKWLTGSKGQRWHCIHGIKLSLAVQCTVFWLQIKKFIKMQPIITFCWRFSLSETFVWWRSLIETETSTTSKNWLHFDEFLIWNVYQPNESVYQSSSLLYLFCHNVLLIAVISLMLGRISYN